MASASLNARPREERGKNAARKLRSAGDVPAVVYGHGDETRPITVSKHDIERLLSSINVGNTIIDLAIEGGKPVQALIREVQHHPSKPQILHLDLMQIHAGEKIHLNLPVRLHGTPVGVRDENGILQEVLREISVECLPKDIPDAIDVDISGLGIGDSVHVSDISAPNVKILNDPDIVICTVTTPTVVELPEAAVSEEGVGGEVEPEIIRSRRDEAEAGE
jgi:large subunit ribosomal protein L25